MKDKEMLSKFTDFLLRPAFSLLSRPLLIPLTTKLFIFFAKALGISNHYMHKSGLTEEEVYFLRNEVGETLYFFHKKFAEGYMGISICHMYNQEPSLILDLVMQWAAATQ